jgi:hypothetical protein
MSPDTLTPKPITAEQQRYYDEAAQLRRENPGMSRQASLQAMTRKYGEPAMQAFRRGKLPD